MISSNTIRSSVAALALSLFAANVACAATWSGDVRGLNHVDKKLFRRESGTVINYSVTASGGGTNTLTFKIQQKKNNGSWKTIAKHTLDMHGASDSASGSVIVDDLRIGEELCRIRVSRKAWTKPIEYSVSY